MSRTQLNDGGGGGGAKLQGDGCVSNSPNPPQLEALPAPFTLTLDSRWKSFSLRTEEEEKKKQTTDTYSCALIAGIILSGTHSAARNSATLS